MKVLNIIYFTFLASLFTGEIIRLQFGDMAITLPDVVLVMLIIIWAILLLTGKIFIARTTQLISIGLFVFICLVSLIVNIHVLRTNESLTAVLYLIRWGAYAALYPVTISVAKDDKKTILRVLEVGGIIVALLGFAQLIFYPSLRNLYYLGWDEHLYRLFTVFLDPNFAGTFFALFTLFVFHQITFDWKNKSARYFHVAALMISTLALIFTFSRSGMILFVVSVTAYLILYKKFKYIVLLIAALVIVYALESSQFHIENINLFRTTSSLARVQTAGTAIDIFAKNSILGVGFDSYRYAQIRYGYRPASTQLVSHADAGTDDSYLFVLATTGSIGFLFYGYMWYTLLRGKGKTMMGERKLLIASTVGLGVNALFINSLFYPFIMSWMWILFGLYGE